MVAIMPVTCKLINVLWETEKWFLYCDFEVLRDGFTAKTKLGYLVTLFCFSPPLLSSLIVTKEIVTVSVVLCLSFFTCEKGIIILST